MNTSPLFRPACAGLNRFWGQERRRSGPEGRDGLVPPARLPQSCDMLLLAAEERRMRVS